MRRNRMIRVMMIVLSALLLSVETASLQAKDVRVHVRNTPTACAPPDQFAYAFRDWAVSLASGGDSTAADRVTIGIPTLADTAIVFVSDSALCDLAAKQHAIRARQDTVSPRPVYLLRLGTSRYVAFNGARAGEYHAYFIFDTAFNFVTSYMM
jgi:hypothetical protein